MTTTDTAPVVLHIPRVENMTGHAGEAVKNQFLIYTGEGVAFQSYTKVIAYKMYGGATYLDETYWDFSTTTGKYRNLFLGDKGKKETEGKIKDGTYVLTNLQP